MSKSFVEFYSKNDISPVSQDIIDLNKHFQRRESLFRSLGLLPSFIAGKSVLEFGPGSGHNALYMASLKPEKYELVDGNPMGVQETRERLAAYSDSQVEVHQSLFEEFQTDTRFDLVWAEGCLPHQSEPLPLLDNISLFVARGGGMWSLQLMESPTYQNLCAVCSVNVFSLPLEMFTNRRNN